MFEEAAVIQGAPSLIPHAFSAPIMSMQSPTQSDVVWYLCSTVFRARYSLLTLALPPLLAGIALFVWPRGTLYSLLLPRGFRNHDVSRQRALADLFWISFTSFCVAALACAGVSLAAIHGPERSPSYSSGVFGGGAGASDSARMIVWPGFLLPIAACAACILPLACLAIWQREQSDDKRSSHECFLGIGCVAVGAVAAAALVVLLGVLRQSLFGVSDWILPILPPPHFAIDHTATGAGILASTGAAFAAIGCRAGYLDDADKLLASQADLVLCVVAASLVYGGSLLGLTFGRKPNVRFCTAVYLLVCIGTAGVILAGAAYWLDRYGFPTLLAAGALVTAIGWLADTDHFFQLRPRLSAAGSSPAAAELPSLRDCFARRLATIPVDESGIRTAIVVTASGGGIQAAAWTAEVLTRLAEQFPHFEQGLCVVSGVSGGSVGAGEFFAGTYLDPPIETSAERDERWRSIRNRSRASLLEQVAWGVAFADLPRLLTGWLPWNRLVDRGWAIEQLLESRLRFSEGGRRDAAPGHPVTLRDLCGRVGSGSIPVPLFNATCVQTGQRVIMSPVRLASDPRAGSRSLHMPADYSRGPFQADPTLATAIRLSATFSYASPVARPTRADEAEWRRAIKLASEHLMPPSSATRFDLHLCDGGYADNTGVVAGAEACRELLAAIGEDRSGRKYRILFARIEPFPRPTAPEPDSENGFSHVVLGPAFGLLSARVATQQERADREVEQFIREALELNSHVIDACQTTFRFGEKRDLPTPPLSWSLSSRQQQAIEDEWLAMVKRAPLGDDIVAYARRRTSAEAVA